MLESNGIKGIQIATYSLYPTIIIVILCSLIDPLG